MVLQVVYPRQYHHIDGISLGFFLIGLFNAAILFLCWLAQLRMIKIQVHDIQCILASPHWFIVISVKKAQ